MSLVSDDISSTILIDTNSFSLTRNVCIILIRAYYLLFPTIFTVTLVIFFSNVLSFSVYV